MSKKLTAKEILEIIEKNYSESAFAFEEWTEADVELTEEEEAICKKADEDREAFYNSIADQLPNTDRANHPLFKQYSAMPSSYMLRDNFITKRLGLGEVEEADCYGGSGKGETWYSVKYFKDHDVYIRIDGFYSSYNGTDFYDGYGKEVKPKEKTITVYN